MELNDSFRQKYTKHNKNNDSLNKDMKIKNKSYNNGIVQKV